MFIYKWRFGSLSSIPTIGTSDPLFSYFGASRLVRHAREVLQEGYEKYKGGVFKVAMYDRWLVVAGGGKLVEELAKYSDDQMSFMEAAIDVIHFKYSMGKNIMDDPFHVDVIRGQLTRNLAMVFPAMCDEIETVFAEAIPATKEWTPVHCFPLLHAIVARISNRAFIGLPMCRHPGYLEVAVKYTRDVANVRRFLSYFPHFLKPVVAPFVTDTKQSLRRAIECLRPTLQERLDLMRVYGKEWPDKPNDMLQWILDAAFARDKGIEAMVSAILSTNFAAVHTTSFSYLHALYYLAANPEYTQPLREEADSVIASEGWTKAAMTNLKKIDGFLRESQRLTGVSGVSVMRKVINDITLSDGTYLPKETVIVVPALATHTDISNYEDPMVFNPYRFLENEDKGTGKYFVSTSPDYLPFGLGKQACPGRFFASNELKAMLAYTAMNYDVKTSDGARPQDEWFALQVVPSPTAKILFKKREF
ncbi:unnamed protein product [Somion occarium]